jgi:hypothetical protein
MGFAGLGFPNLDVMMMVFADCCAPQPGPSVPAPMAPLAGSEKRILLTPGGTHRSGSIFLLHPLFDFRFDLIQLLLAFLLKGLRLLRVLLAILLLILGTGDLWAPRHRRREQ